MTQQELQEALRIELLFDAGWDVDAGYGMTALNVLRYDDDDYCEAVAVACIQEVCLS